mmetsp:Transcript_28195/g.34904  ORF Transcript_28195/g.34904 Transcript_28195/m.34904 type:complete len:80 (-) Transcript_28195:6443-6682(-)
MTRNGAALTVAATDNTLHAKSYTMQVTHSTPDNGNQVYKTVTMTIGWCVITSVATPTTPTSAATAYTIFSPKKTITLTP